LSLAYRVSVPSLADASSILLTPLSLPARLATYSGLRLAFARQARLGWRWQRLTLLVRRLTAASSFAAVCIPSFLLL